METLDKELSILTLMAMERAKLLEIAQIATAKEFTPVVLGIKPADYLELRKDWSTGEKEIVRK